MPSRELAQAETELFRLCAVIPRLRATNQDGMRSFAKRRERDILPQLSSVFDGLSGAVGLLPKLNVEGSNPFARSRNKSRRTQDLRTAPCRAALPESESQNGRYRFGSGRGAATCQASPSPIQSTANTARADKPSCARTIYRSEGADDPRRAVPPPEPAGAHVLLSRRGGGGAAGRPTRREDDADELWQPTEYKPVSEAREGARTPTLARVLRAIYGGCGKAFTQDAVANEAEATRWAAPWCGGWDRRFA
jgi:hypothetical protein